MAEANFESLNLEISVNAKKATEQVAALASAMQSLNRAMGKLDSSIVKKAFPKIAEQAEKAARRVEKAMGRIENAQNGIVNGGAKSLGKRTIEDAAEDLTEQVRKMWGVMRNPHMGQVGRTSLGEQLAKDIKSSKGIIRDAADEVGKIAGESIREAIHNAVTRPVDRTEWFPASITGGNLGSGIISRSFSSEYATRSMQAAAFGKGITQSFSVAIQQTRAFTQVTKTLSAVTSVLSPTLKAAGVSVKAFGAAMSAAAPPITAVVLAIQAAVKIATFLVDQFNEFINTIKTFKKVMDGLNERFNPFVGLKKELGYLISLAKRQVLRRAINAAIKAITEGLKSGVENLAQYDERFSEVVQSFHNAMGLFKNSIGVAVAPIISYFIPALNQMLAALTAAMNTLARLTALLTGQHTYTVAKSYEEIGDSAGGASSAVKELQRTILGFDEINKLNRPSGSGGGGGGGAGDAISAYETLSVGDWPYDSWGEALLDFIKWLDGTGVPKLRAGLDKVSKFVNEFSRNLYGALTYDGVQDAIANLATHLGETLNNFLNGGEGKGGLNWADMGKSIGMGIQTAFNFAANFLLQLDFFALGQNIATFVNNAIQQINPKDIADVLFTPIRAAFGLVVGFLTNFDFPEFAQRAGEVVNHMVEALAKLIRGGTGEKHGGKWQSYLEIAANNIAAGLVSFFDTVDWEALFSTLRTAVSAIINGLKTILKRLMADKNFVNAVHQFVEFVINTAVQWFVLKIRAMASMTAGTNVFRTAASSLFEGVFGDGLDFDPFGSNSALARSLAGISADFEEFGDTATGVLHAIDKTASSTSSISSTAFANITASMTKTATDSAKPVSDLDRSIGSIGTASKEAAVEVQKQTVGTSGSVVSFLKSMNTQGTSAAEALRSSMATKMAQMSSNAAGEAENVRKAVVGKITETKNLLPAFTDVGKNIKDGIIGGMGDFKGKLDEWASQFKKRILDNFNIKSPSRWAEEFVGTYISEGIAVGMMDGSRSVEQACAGLKEGISSEFSNMSFVGNVRTGGIDIAGAIGNQVMAGVASMTTNNQQPIVCEVYLDRDKIATAVTRGQRAQNRRYSPTALAY